MIRLDMDMEDLVRDYPQVVSVLVRSRVVCIQCGEPVWGTLEEALERAGIEDKGEMLKQLQAVAKSSTN